jgi:mRNA-degrading endonuclease RelE of RelBE toxin-antitoxin system
VSYQLKPTRSFVEAARRLKRKYPHIQQDLKRLHAILSTEPTRGVAIPGFSHTVWKIRLASVDMQSGKRGGYRVIYTINPQEQACYLLTIYAKADQSDITTEQVRQLLIELLD